MARHFGSEAAQDLKKRVLFPHRRRHRRGKRCGSCHGGAVRVGAASLPKLFLVGNPNVGKSVLFNRLTGLYVTVSNYPGTTVEVSRGQARILGRSYEVVDTPGMYSLLPITEEERVARSLLLSERPDAVLHVVDAKNLERMLPLTIQLIEAGLPVILVVNIMDEAEELGLKIETGRLAQRLGIPVVGTVSTTGRGLDELKRTISSFSAAVPSPAQPLQYAPAIEEALGKLQSALSGDYSLSRRAVALLLLQEDEEIWRLAKAKEGPRFPLLRDLFRQLRQGQPAPFS
ncbi:MAG: FeoB small GTPase domain-containing protein, partial [Bacillota bacterium]|nr:FeoB small GTPase domain-containing protein [Bacillota bacterium]